MNERYNIENIENFLAEKLRALNIVDYVFEGHRPNTVEETIKTFAVVGVATTVHDLNTHGKCICTIQYFVKNLRMGLKNSRKMSSIYTGLCKLFPIESEDYIFLSRPRVVPLGADKEGYTVNAVEIDTLIKSI